MLVRLVKLSVLLGILVAVGLGLTYLHVDSKVRNQLKIRKFSVAPGIYSRPFDVYAGKIISDRVLISELERRQYKRVATRPSKPGEYFEQGGVFEIFLRQFHHPKAGEQRHALILYHSKKGLIENDSQPGVESFSLEPILISPLGTSDIRASSFQPLAKIPKHVQRLLLAAEDHRFYEHHGVDPVGIARAFFANVLAGRIVQGGSTLTQQLAKNLLFTPRRSYLRKLLEVFAALSLESHYSKDEILEMYLNEVYLGQEGSVAIHGFPEAARAFFGKTIADINHSEAALLAGIIRAPSYNAPRQHLQRAIKRRNSVLKRALELEYISQLEYRNAIDTVPRVSAEARFKRNAPYFEVALIKHLEAALNTEAMARAGVRVYTGLDLSLQRCAQQAVTQGLSLIEERKPLARKVPGGIEVGLVAIEPHSGLVRAWVGGRNYKKNQFDHVFQAKRQIGSTVKPFVYLTALDQDANDYKTATASSIIRDAPYKVSQPGQADWRPENFDKKYKGDVTLRFALEKSLNIPSVYVAMRVGIEFVARTIDAFHLADRVEAVPAIALGALDTTLLDLTAGYAALANGGIHIQPRLFLHAVDKEETVLASSEINERRVANEAATFVVTNILQGVLDRGTGTIVRREGYKGIAAGKTGTSNDTRDSWFLGYTTQLATGVWVGNDDNQSTSLTGASGAGVIWSHFMQCASELLEDRPFLPPTGVSFVDIDPRTGKRVTNECRGSGVVKEVYVRGTEPPLLCETPYGDSGQKRTYNPQQPTQRRRKRKSFWDLIWDTD